MIAATIRKVHGEVRGAALAGYIRPFSKGLRAKALTVEAQNFVAGRRSRVIATVPRTADAAADHAVADSIVNAFEIAEAVRQLLRDGVSDRHGDFTYTPPPRAGGDAIARLRQLLEAAPPPPLTRCQRCKLRVEDER